MGNKHSILEKEVNIGHFKLLNVIGKGAFGCVRIIQKRDTKQKFALKYISKDKCIKKQSIKNVIRERLILEKATHPFIINLNFAFQDDHHLFFVLDLATGGDLRFLLTRVGCLSLQTIRMYAAELVSAISYLHGLKILHRDLKPENLLIDEDGHIHITDFNVAILLAEKIPSSRSGTLAYMAPEMFTGKPYSYSVDWWSLGVVLFECTYGTHPFGDTTNTERAICEKTPSFKTPSKSKQIRFAFQKCADRKDLLIGLLEKDFRKRIGVNSDIKNHSFFSQMNWDSVDKRRCTPDYIPDAEGNNYDFGAALEELLYESSPLNSKPIRKRERNRNGQKDRSSPPLSFLWSDEKSAMMESELDYLEDYFPSYCKDSSAVEPLSRSSSNSPSPPHQHQKVRKLVDPQNLMRKSSTSSSNGGDSFVLQDRKSSLSTSAQTMMKNLEPSPLDRFDNSVKSFGLRGLDSLNSSS